MLNKDFYDCDVFTPFLIWLREIEELHPHGSGCFCCFGDRQSLLFDFSEFDSVHKV